MQLSSRILTAVAVLILAVAVVAVRGVSSGTLEAATGTIDVLNVGTCYTTNSDALGAGDCDDGDGNEADTPTAGYDVAGRDSVTQVASGSNIYATYAIDPKSSGDAPRAILTNSDLIKISIKDKGRDKRTGKIYPVGAATATLPLTAAQTAVIDGALSDDELSEISTDADDNVDTADVVTLSSATAFFTQSVTTIDSSGVVRLNLTGDGSTEHPMAPEGDGKIVWFGCLAGTCETGGDATETNRFRNLTDNYVELDEDLSTGTRGSIAPWMRVEASVEQGTQVNIQYIYYQTSDREILAGGKKKSDYIGDDADENLAMFAPVFVDNEDKDTAALVLGAGSDGDTVEQNLWLKETGDFTGVYEGYLRLTDADGHGDGDDRSNWGRMTDDAGPSEDGDVTGSSIAGAAVLGVESGPVKIRYKNSNGDVRTAEILIDKTPPAIQVTAPAHNTSSKDDSPDLLGSFNDGGGSGLRADSFKVYADNKDDSNDEDPVWDFKVNNAGIDATNTVGYVCVDADGNGECGASDTAALRGHYSGYGTGAGTFGIIKSMDVYLSTDDSDADDGGDEDTADDYKTASAEDYDDGATSGEFDSVVRIDFPPDEDNDNRYNNTVDIQAVVLDVAGNYGFSDSHASDPTFIHDYGTASKDRKADIHNVLGWYSRHQYRLDDVDPKYEAAQSATGFFTDADGDETMSASGVKIVFDNDVDASSIGLDTFVVTLDSKETATITGVDVKGKVVYLMLEETLAPDSTPQVDLASGASIADLAGNEATDRRLDGFELSDGILPTFTITLSGGTGLNEDVDGEGSSELTRGQMTISIEANEDIQGAPSFAVVCSGLTWGNDDANDVAKFASERKGAKTDGVPNPSSQAKCSEGDEEFGIPVTSALARPGNKWEYLWANLSGNQELDDGKLSVIVWGRDRSSYKSGENDVHNFSSATATFRLDTDLMAAWEEGEDSELVPANGDEVFEPRPFVLLDFGDEDRTVNVTKFTVDKVDYTADLQDLDDQEFVWWPEPLDPGKYTVYVEANDAANNKGDHTYSFTVKERSPFVISLLAGWNSISFPANPVDSALHAVFTDPAVDRVVGWNVTNPVSPWRLATRVDGVWTTGEEYATLNDVEARYGYWVHSTGFITQAVQLAGKEDRAIGGQPTPAAIPTDMGWNFVGVVDVDGEQTQDNAGETLRNSNNDPITAAEYLGNYTRAYTWDHVNNTWDVVNSDEGVTIGTGVWVYYTKGHDIAP